MNRRQGVDIEGMSTFLDETPVRYALLFGSHARDDADTTSDVDIALCFPEEMSARERFDHRNRIDAELQSYADATVDVSDLQNLPVHVARRALEDGHRLAGDEAAIESDIREVGAEYDSSAAERMAAAREYIEKLAEGRN